MVGARIGTIGRQLHNRYRLPIADYQSRVGFQDQSRANETGLSTTFLWSATVGKRKIDYTWLVEKINTKNAMNCTAEIAQRHNYVLCYI